MVARKKKKKKQRKKLDEAMKEPNQVVYADLLFPNNYRDVLVVMNGYSRFVKIHLLKSKTGRMLKKMDTKKHSVKQVFTDKDGGIINDAMEARCNSQGIEQIQVI
ncbi:Gag/pol Polyprotein [Phytophthora palmivora]|uniref:Gag/pol Polyprotein n=1 Tax=Phytophthora palmivora TaxID=4796 RepID=A0A2P4X8M8_9STRA|nr:Gag/pol Polyprotein [Phytophthora palmivora]